MASSLEGTRKLTQLLACQDPAEMLTDEVFRTVFQGFAEKWIDIRNEALARGFEV
jgi:hypothetical protein